MKHIQDRYIQNSEEEWCDFTLSTSGLLNITIVSERFAKIPLSQRDEQIRELLHEANAPTTTGFLSLYTTSEADAMALSRPAAKQESRVDNWSDLAQEAMNPSEYPKVQRRKPRIPHTVTFYSFKGGVGRTTALIHVAWILAMRGRKVVAVDLDLEAPGLSALPNLTPIPEHGIVDYFYERSYIPQGVEPRISIVDIFGEVRIQNAPGRLFIVPAGSLDLNYITKLDDLRASAITEHGEDLWSVFFREITEQLQPDIILVNSRTGINEWGAFSLLRAADQAVVFLYPNEQNKCGIDLLLEALAGRVTLQLVFSPVPFGDAGEEKVKEYWQSFQGRLDVAANQPYPDINEQIQEVKAQLDLAEPITINYFSELALASSYPVLSHLSRYLSIANLVEEDTFAVSLEPVLSDKDRRHELLESLKFPSVNTAASDQNLRDLFQRTANFERFLDDTTSLIRGQKGTGKTTLCELLLKHENVARKLSKRLDRVTCLPGHGRFCIHPTRDDFQLVDQSIKQNGKPWDPVWWSYLLLRMHLENLLQQFKRNGVTEYNQLWSVLDKVPEGADRWQMEHTRVLVDIATNDDLADQAFSALLDIGMQLRGSRQVFWFLYDDLDKDLLEKDDLRDEVLTSFFQLVRYLERRTSMRFKLFLREDVWSRLAFDTKSYFNGRNIILQWTSVDFLRLALRQAQQSKNFKDLVDRFAPVENIDQADEALIDRALQLLWGTRREPNSKSRYVSRWVYDRLTDSSGTAFPSSVNILLTEAKKHALTYKPDQPLPIADRLLPVTSLHEGLLQASKQRCAEVREEYPKLRPFFDALANLDALVSKRQLQELWERNGKGVFLDFSEFAEFLLVIGLIGLAEAPGKEQVYQFAEIYASGFNMRGR